MYTIIVSNISFISAATHKCCRIWNFFKGKMNFKYITELSLNNSVYEGLLHQTLHRSCKNPSKWEFYKLYRQTIGISPSSINICKNFFSLFTNKAIFWRGILNYFPIYLLFCIFMQFTWEHLENKPLKKKKK